LIFRDRDFFMSNLGVATIGFVVTAMILPVMFYAQAVCGLSPTRSALLTAPMAIATGLLAPVVGKIVDSAHPRPVVGFGFSMLAIALTWLSIEMTPTTPIWRLVLPLIGMGVGMAFIWSPLAATATRNLPPRLAGAGSGVYNATRQVGSVLGSAGMAAFMTWRIGSEMPPMPEGTSQGGVTRLPTFLHEPFAAAMSQSLLLPAFVALLGVIAALFLLGFGNARLDDVDLAAADADAGYAVEYGGDETFVDDDEYVEYTVSWDEPELAPPPAVGVDDENTEPIQSRPNHLLHAPAEAWHDAPVESWHSLLDDELVEPVPETPPKEEWRSILDELLADLPAKSAAEPIGFAHNGFHVDDEQRFQPVDRPGPLAEPSSPFAGSYGPGLLPGEGPSDRPSRHERPVEHERPARHHRSEEEPETRSYWFESYGKHSRDDPDDAASYGRHSLPGLD
jgi:hypothetical protein